MSVFEQIKSRFDPDRTGTLTQRVVTMDDSFQARPTPSDQQTHLLSSQAQDTRKQVALGQTAGGIRSSQDTPSFLKQMVQQKKQALQAQ